MSLNFGSRNGIFFWRLRDDFSRSGNVDVSRRYHETVSLSVGVGQTFCGHELTPAEARKVAEALLAGADVVEEYLEMKAEEEAETNDNES